MKLIALSLFSFYTTVFQVEYTRVKLGDNATASLPSLLIPMTETDYIGKYQSYRMPAAIYTNGTREIDFTYNLSPTNWGDNDIDLLYKFQRTNIINLHTKVEFIQDTVKTINGRSFAVFEFVSKITDRTGSISKYHYIQYTVQNYKVHLFTFLSPEKEKERWQPIAGRIMNSVRLNK